MTAQTHQTTQPAQPPTAEDGVLHLSGAFDARRTAQVRDELYRRLDGSAPHGHVVVDLSEVSSVDATALRVLAAASRWAAREKRHLVLRGCPPPVRRMLALTHLRRLVELERPLAAVG